MTRLFAFIATIVCVVASGGHACTSPPDGASAVERAIIENQCAILEALQGNASTSSTPTRSGELVPTIRYSFDGLPLLGQLGIGQPEQEDGAAALAYEFDSTGATITPSGSSPSTSDPAAPSPMPIGGGGGPGNPCSSEVFAAMLDCGPGGIGVGGGAGNPCNYDSATMQLDCGGIGQIDMQEIATWFQESYGTTSFSEVPVIDYYGSGLVDLGSDDQLGCVLMLDGSVLGCGASGYFDLRPLTPESIIAPEVEEPELMPFTLGIGVD